MDFLRKFQDYMGKPAGNVLLGLDVIVGKLLVETLRWAVYLVVSIGLLKYIGGII